MNECERRERKLKRIARLRRERRRKLLTLAMGMLISACLICVCVISYHSISSNASNGYKYYTSVTVKAGDSLCNLANEFWDESHYDDKESYIQEVCSINHLEDATKISAGQSLIMPYYSVEYIY